MKQSAREEEEEEEEEMMKRKKKGGGAIHLWHPKRKMENGKWKMEIRKRNERNGKFEAVEVDPPSGVEVSPTVSSRLVGGKFKHSALPSIGNFPKVLT